MRLRKPFRILLIAISVFIVVSLYYPIRSIVKLMNQNYTLESSLTIKKIGMYDYVMNIDYNKTLDMIVNDKDFKKDNLDKYIEIIYRDRKDFVKNINELLDDGYTTSDINIIYSRSSDEFINKLKKNFVLDIYKYLSVEYFKEENFSRYQKYYNGNYTKTIIYVNIGLDKEFYKDTIINDSFSNTMVVNKYRGLAREFEGNDLVEIDSEYRNGSSSMFLNKEAYDAFVKMCNDASKKNLKMSANSAYRSYSDQQDTWDYYLKNYGQKYNDKYVTRPGYSEHQTGLAIDIKGASSNIFKNSKEYSWIQKNGYKYGFIHRYPEGKEIITGISSEAWHYRYVGVDVATYIYENNLTLEEYYAMFVEK